MDPGPRPGGSSNSNRSAGPGIVADLEKYLGALKRFNKMDDLLPVVFQISEFWLLDNQYIYSLCLNYSMSRTVVENAFLDWILADKVNRMQYLGKLCDLIRLRKTPVPGDQFQNPATAAAEPTSGESEESLKQKLEDLTTQNGILVQEIEELKTKDAVLNAELGNSRDKIGELEQQIEHHDQTIASQKLQIDGKTLDLEQKAVEIGHMKTNLEILTKERDKWKTKYDKSLFEVNQRDTELVIKLKDYMAEHEKKLEEKDQIILKLQETTELKFQDCEGHELKEQGPVDELIDAGEPGPESRADTEIAIPAPVKIKNAQMDEKDSSPQSVTESSSPNVMQQQDQVVVDDLDPSPKRRSPRTPKLSVKMRDFVVTGRGNPNPIPDEKNAQQIAETAAPVPEEQVPSTSTTEKRASNLTEAGPTGIPVKKPKTIPTTKPNVAGANQPSTEYICTDCGAIYPSYPGFVYHRLTHTGEKKYECKVCGMKFMVKTSLKRHLQTRSHSSQAEMSQM